MKNDNVKIKNIQVKYTIKYIIRKIELNLLLCPYK